MRGRSGSDCWGGASKALGVVVRSSTANCARTNGTSTHHAFLTAATHTALPALPAHIFPPYTLQDRLLREHQANKSVLATTQQSVSACCRVHARAVAAFQRLLPLIAGHELSDCEPLPTLSQLAGHSLLPPHTPTRSLRRHTTKQLLAAGKSLDKLCAERDAAVQQLSAMSERAARAEAQARELRADAKRTSAAAAALQQRLDVVSAPRHLRLGRREERVVGEGGKGYAAPSHHAMRSRPLFALVQPH